MTVSDGKVICGLRSLGAHNEKASVLIACTILRTTSDMRIILFCDAEPAAANAVREHTAK